MDRKTFKTVWLNSFWFPSYCQKTGLGHYYPSICCQRLIHLNYYSISFQIIKISIVHIQWLKAYCSLLRCKWKLITSKLYNVTIINTCWCLTFRRLQNKPRSIAANDRISNRMIVMNATITGSIAWIKFFSAEHQYINNNIFT